MCEASSGRAKQAQQVKRTGLPVAVKHDAMAMPPAAMTMRRWRFAERTAIAAYGLLLRLFTPAYLSRLLWRGRAEPLYRTVMGERLGFYFHRDGAATALQQGAERPLWIHAVSLGETRAAAALVDALRVLRPDLRLLLTHSTATGRDAGQALLRNGDAQVWLPYDTPGAVRRFYAAFRPALGVLIETEVWPNLLREAVLRGVPVALANARLSARSRARGARLDALMRPAAGSLALVLAQTGEDAVRLIASGAPRVEVAGNLKYDVTPDPALLQRGARWKQVLAAGGFARPVLLAAVTREGEEAMLLRAWTATPAPHDSPARTGISGTAKRPLLVIVPRHPQRFDEVAALVRAHGCTLARRSAWGDMPDAEACAADVWLGDSIGEMACYYAAAHVALLGGSYTPVGGQNLIEAAACGCPLVMGPSTYNFADAAQRSLAAGASVRVADFDAAVAVALGWLRDREGLAERSRHATAFASQHRGAARRMAGRIVELLPPTAARPTTV
jgi:3-deoxy-D-manno-octulosonic-acid transferase